MNGLQDYTDSISLGLFYRVIGRFPVYALYNMHIVIWKGGINYFGTGCLVQGYNFIYIKN
ncbi:hypothetical protein COR50_02605 [Chitinophaga caeni]|uniref:Uncharacterized protein n=1 Tax=Chitinophaga caeni TaxID=2029983 RepID=A0A291QQM9_9BACT|nr:hypothetical protein COR50_02605 [Chitinophaga caeni]